MLGLRKGTRNRNLTTKETSVDPKCFDDPLLNDVVDCFSADQQQLDDPLPSTRQINLQFQMEKGQLIG